MWTLASSPIHGRGVRVTRFVPAGTNLGLAHWFDGREWMATDLGKFHNHSASPNARNVRYVHRRYLVATRDLWPGEEITVDYRLQPELEQPRADWR